MSQFQIEDVKALKLKVFIKQFSEIQQRFDAHYYWEDIDFTNCIKLSKIAKVSGGKRLPKGFDYSKEATKYRYLRIGDIDWFGNIEYENLNYISEKLFKKLKNYEIQNGDLLLAIVGATIGKLSLLNVPNDDRVILTENCAKITLRNNKVIPEYLQIILHSKFIQKQIQLNFIQTTLPKLGLDRVSSLYIPTPPSLEKQQEILNNYKVAFLSKQQKENEAKELLASIDTYLLDELGIELPEKDNSLENRIFTASIKKISGGRFDPKLYDNFTSALRLSIKENKYKADNLRLKDFLIQSFAGSWGEDELKHIEDKFFKKCLVIRATEFDNKYNLDVDNLRVKYRLISRKKLQTLDIQSNDLLIEKSGGSPAQPVGRISIITEEMIEKHSLCYSNFIHKIRIDTEICNPTYLFNFLKTVHNIKLTDAMQSQTNGIRNLIMSNYFNQTIPLPPKEKQTEMANHITDLRNQAKQLELDANQIMTEAKAEVENIILGQ